MTLLCITLFSGCATSRDVNNVVQQVRLSHDINPSTSLTLGKFENKSRQQIPEDAEERFYKGLRGELLKKGIRISSKDNEGIKLDVVLLQYIPGNAAQRWLSPDYGMTVCELRVDLTDQKTNQSLGFVSLQENLSGLWFLTAHSNRSVFRKLAIDTVSLLAREGVI